MTVLVLTSADDDTATRVCTALRYRRRPHLRADLGDFPEHLSINATHDGTGWTGRLRAGHEEVDLAEITSVYWRRPTAFRFAPGLSAQERRFANAETRQGLGGLICGLQVPFVNHPARVADAELKPAQLQVAAQVGFDVPATLITSDIAAAQMFLRAHDRVLYKPLTAAFLRGAGRTKLVYVTPVTVADLTDPAALRSAPCQFQTFVDKSHDVRLVVAGHRRFAVAIHAGSDAARVDWRADYLSLTYETVPVPSAIDGAITAYLDRFGLVFGCFDFSVDREGRWWFLECGANAQWGWLEHETGLPIADAIADLLDPITDAASTTSRMSA